MRFIRHVLATFVLLCATQVQADIVAGQDYRVLGSPQPVNSGNKVEVLEFFFYGCSHCYHLHPQLSAWEKKKPRDVELQYVPVIFRESWEPMARTFYALEAIGQREQLHEALFEAWNVHGTDLGSEAKIGDFVAQRGVDRTRFKAAYNSFALRGKISRSMQLVQSYGVRGTPTLAVDGKYIITGLTPAETIRVLDEVIALARKERAGKR